MNSVTDLTPKIETLNVLWIFKPFCSQTNDHHFVLEFKNNAASILDAQLSLENVIAKRYSHEHFIRV